jgi:hypothetical protein
VDLVDAYLARGAASGESTGAVVWLEAFGAAWLVDAQLAAARPALAGPAAVDAVDVVLALLAALGHAALARLVEVEVLLAAGGDALALGAVPGLAGPAAVPARAGGRDEAEAAGGAALLGFAALAQVVGEALEGGVGGVVVEALFAGFEGLAVAAKRLEVEAAQVVLAGLGGGVDGAL